MLCKLDYSAFGDGQPTSGTSPTQRLARCWAASKTHRRGAHRLRLQRHATHRHPRPAGQRRDRGRKGSQRRHLSNTHRLRHPKPCEQCPVAGPQPGASRPEDTYTYLPGNNPPQTDISIAGLTGERKVTYLYNQSGPATSPSPTPTRPQDHHRTWDDRNMPLAKTDQRAWSPPSATTHRVDPTPKPARRRPAPVHPAAARPTTAACRVSRPPTTTTRTSPPNRRAHGGHRRPTGASPDRRAPSGVPTNAWSMVLTGEIQLAATGNYTFQATAADGVNLYVDDVPYLNRLDQRQKTPRATRSTTPRPTRGIESASSTTTTRARRSCRCNGHHGRNLDRGAGQCLDPAT